MEPTQRSIVIGASAGGVEALQAVVARLPAELPAPVFVVLHLPPIPPVHCRRSSPGRGRCPLSIRQTVPRARLGSSMWRLPTTIS